MVLPGQPGGRVRRCQHHMEARFLESEKPGLFCWATVPALSVGKLGGWVGGPKLCSQATSSPPVKRQQLRVVFESLLEDLSQARA